MMRNKTFLMLFLLILVVAVTVYSLQSNAASVNDKYQYQLHECEKLMDNKSCQSVIEELNK
jgi:hypothetical protein